MSKFPPTGEFVEVEEKEEIEQFQKGRISESFPRGSMDVDATGDHSEITNFLKGMKCTAFNENPVNSDFLLMVNDGVRVEDVGKIFLKQEVDGVVLIDYIHHEAKGFFTYTDFIGTMLLYNDSFRFYRQRAIMDAPIGVMRSWLLGEKEEIVGKDTENPKFKIGMLEEQLILGSSSGSLDGDENLGDSEGNLNKSTGSLNVPPKRERATSDVSHNRRPKHLDAFRSKVFGGGDILVTRSRKLSDRSEEEFDDTGVPFGFRDIVCRDPLALRGLMQDVIGLRIGATMWDAMNAMVKHRIHRIPLFDSNSNLVMVLRHFDIIQSMVHYFNFTRPILKAPINELGIIRRPGAKTCIRTFKEDDFVRDVLVTMVRSGMTFVPVVNDHGRVIDVFAKPDVYITLEEMLFHHDRVRRSSSDPTNLEIDDDDDDGGRPVDGDGQGQAQNPSEPPTEGKKKHRKSSFAVKVGQFFRLEDQTISSIIIERHRLLRFAVPEADVHRRLSKDIFCWHTRLEHTATLHYDDMVESDEVYEKESGGGGKYQRVKVEEITVTENVGLGKVIRHICGKPYKYLLVKDDHGRFAGIITIMDIFELIIRHYQEDFRKEIPKLKHNRIMRKQVLEAEDPEVMKQKKKQKQKKLKGKRN